MKESSPTGKPKEDSVGEPHIFTDKSKNFNEVAEIMDYTDPLHFSRTFKKVMGIAPSEFIKLSSGKNQSGTVQA